MTAPLAGASAQLADTAPLLRRAVGLNPRGVARIRLGADSVTSYVRLPFGVLVSRTVKAQWDGPSIDSVVSAQELLDWLDGASAAVPATRDALWQGTLPPRGGWQRLEIVPDTVIRDLVGKGAAALQEAAQREGMVGAQPRAEVADALLDSVVITAERDDLRTEVALRTLSALTRMGFLARGSSAAIDVSGRWTRVVAEYGTVYAERRGSGLNVL